MVTGPFFILFAHIADTGHSSREESQKDSYKLIKCSHLLDYNNIEAVKRVKIDNLFIFVPLLCC